MNTDKSDSAATVFTPDPDKRLYEVRYPDGDTVRLYAHRMLVANQMVCLFREQGDTPGNMIFVAGINSGITVSQPEFIASTLTPPPYAPGQHIDLVRRDMIEAYREKWGTTVDYAAKMMEHVEQCAIADAYPDTTPEA